ncbi:type II toxin-antitoxin system RelE/ParE family toxin [Xenophilus azovorans]|uniref:type II toxin-antitoxin system RelE/ParE family toxin n=1 Tax=Xenophilus azovorans TaxID=151755 RepID=UPI001B80BB83|nr:type II toxin-antitoxin system RelE/ParE family toxin [Xenophilus azovorans]
MRIRWLRKALLNLDEEASDIAQDDPRAAQLVLQRVLDSVAKLAEQTGLGRPGRVPGTRELIGLKTRYLVPYRVRGQTIEILRVFTVQGASRHAGRRSASVISF